MIKVFRDLHALPAFNNAVITIGTFDGVHLGHQQILAQLTAEAKAIGGETIIITFHPHPRKVVGGHLPFKILTTLYEKVELLEAHGIGNVVVIPFDESFASQAPEEYIQHFLVEKFKPHTIIIGYDHRFGAGRQGDYQMLEAKSAEFGYRVKEISEHLLNEVIISSTRIREALSVNDVATANRYLGYAYFFEGTVIEGNKLGRTLGYPTANLQLHDDEKLVPGNGVYAVTAQLGDAGTLSETFRGMMNIGTRPTVDGSGRAIEVNLFDFDREIYGQRLRVHVHHYLRGEIKFSGLPELTEQLGHDKKQVLKLFETF